jgi:carbonic anhydrase
VDGLLPGLPNLDPDADPQTQLDRAVEANVRWALRQITESPEGQISLAEGRMKVVGAVYELKTGRVRLVS